MGILENTLGAMLGGQHGGGGQNLGGGSPYAPLATALIGLLAAKAMTGGFGNLGGMLGGSSGSQATTPNAGLQPGGGGPMAAGGGLLGGLGGLLHQFQQNGQGSLVNSWVGHGPNEPATPEQIRHGLGPETVSQLAQHTGMSPDQVAAELSQGLPDIVNRLTPNGRLPTHEEVSMHV